MGLNFRRLGLSELLPRYLYVEPLIAGRRVLEVGAVAATQGESARFLLDRGASQVLAVDSQAAAVGAASARFGREVLSYSVAPTPSLDRGEPVGFDLILIADLEPFVVEPEALTALIKWLNPDGSLVGGLRNPAGLALSQVMEPEGPPAPPTLGQLLDVLQPLFPLIETSSQTASLGYQLSPESAELASQGGGEAGPGDTEVGLEMDGSLANTGEAAYFLVTASRAQNKPLQPVWVQVPLEPLAYNAGRLERQDARQRALEDEVATLRARLVELEGRFG